MSEGRSLEVFLGGYVLGCALGDSLGPYDGAVHASWRRSPRADSAIRTLVRDGQVKHAQLLCSVAGWLFSRRGETWKAATCSATRDVEA